MRRLLILLNGIIIGLLTTGLIIYSQSCCTTTVLDLSEVAQPNILQNKSLSPHDPIYIDDDNDFIIYGFAGNGTLASPYLIDGFSIINSTDVDGIVIKYTTKYFVITNCYIEVNGYGIYIWDVGHDTVVIANNRIKGCQYSAIELVSVNNPIVINNTGLDVSIGLRISYCSSAYVCNNTFIGDSPISDDYWAGLYLDSCPYSKLLNNTIEGFNRGIFLAHTTSTLIANNTILSSKDFGGIYLYINCDYNLVINNTIENNSDNVGIRLVRSEYNEFCYNTLLNNSDYGCYLGSQSENNFIHHNNFINNNNDTVQGYADLDTNIWYQTIVNEGNYWSDWDGLNPYAIDGSNIFDLYPLHSLAVMNWTGFHFSLTIDDVFEENDRIEDASEIPIGETLHLIYSDVDFFLFSINDTACIETIIEFNNYFIDLDLFLLPANFSGNSEDILASSVGSTDQETIEYNRLTSGVYYLLVERQDASFNILAYTLTLRIIFLSSQTTILSLPSFIWIIAALITTTFVTAFITRKLR